MKYVLTEPAVRKLRGVLAPRSGNTGAGGAATPVSPDKFPPPFTVRWAQSENSGQGAWVIWLPDASQLVMYDKAYITPSGITAGADLPSGWYKISGMQSSAEEVWLVAHIPDPDATGSPSAELSDSEGQATTGESIINLLIAQMETDDDTGAKRVKQFVDSAVIFGSGSGSGGTVALDDVSTDFNDDDEVEIHNWKDGTPASGTTVAQDINNPPSNPPSLVERDHNGALKYKGLGTLAQLLGSTVTFSGKTILTGWNWNATTHEIEISTATVSAANGVITSWTDQPVQTIPTTPISSILPQSGGS